MKNGRPPKVNVGIKVSPEIREALEKFASDEHTKLAPYVERVLVRHVRTRTKRAA
jgi:hypothetical protein